MIELNLENQSQAEPSRIRDYSNLLEAIDHAKVGEVVYIVDAKSNKRQRVERTKDGWIYDETK
jgi:hypothetical protein